MPPTPITTSAPAKLFLLGEHVVVFNGMCLVTTVDARLYLTLTPRTDQTVIIDAPDVGLQGWQRPLAEVLKTPSTASESAFIENGLAHFASQYPFLKTGLHIETRSEFPREYGIGSSSAVVAALLWALTALYNVAPDKEKLLKLGTQAIRRVQPRGSGADLAAALYGGTIYYENHLDGWVQPLEVENDWPLMIVYSGTKANTKHWVQHVKEYYDRWPEAVQTILTAMIALVDQGKQLLRETADWPRLGELMNMQHGLLHSLGVDTPALSRIVFSAREAGAWGAKLSGAGGGDCAIILTPPDRQAAVRARLTEQGFEILDLAVHVEGARLETG